MTNGKELAFQAYSACDNIHFWHAGKLNLRLEPPREYFRHGNDPVDILRFIFLKNVSYKTFNMDLH